MNLTVLKAYTNYTYSHAQFEKLFTKKNKKKTDIIT